MPYVVLLLLAIVFALRMRARAVDEHAARILETAAAAVRRGLPVDPHLLWHAAQERRGRIHHRIRDAARRLDAGEPLADALGGPLRLRESERAAIAAADGTPAMADALERAAGNVTRQIDIGRRIATGMLYPAAVLVLAAFVGLVFGRLREVFDSMDIDSSSFGDAEQVATGAMVLLGVVLLLALLLHAARYVGWLEGPARLLREGAGRLPLAAPAVAADRAARFLEVVAVRLATGASLSTAFTAGGRAVPGSRLAGAAPRVASALHAGGDAGAAWRALPLPRGVAESAALVSVAPAPGALLARIAEHCRADAEERTERLLAWFPILTTLVVAVVIGLALHTFFVSQGLLLTGLSR